jgi:hypothetical protein
LNKQECISFIKKEKDIEKLVNQTILNPELIETLIEIINTEKSSIKFTCEKILRQTSEVKPILIYPYFDFFVDLLQSDNNFLKWGTVITISNLTLSDIDNKFDKIFDKYFKFISGPSMITSSNIIKSSWKIANAKPKLTNKIANEILKVEKASYEIKGEFSPECKNIVCGYAIDSFDKFFGKIKNKDKIIKFVCNQVNNTRNSVRKKAEKFLKKYT